MFTYDCRNSVNIQFGFGRDWYDIEEVYLVCQELQVRQQIGFFLYVVYFVYREDYRRFVFAQFVEYYFVVRRLAGVFNDKNYQFNIVNRVVRRFVYQAVNGAFFFYMQVRCIDVDRLIRVFSMDFYNAVTSCLRFAGSDGDFLFQQFV